MPELAEVQTVINGLKKNFLSKKIKKVIVNNKNLRVKVDEIKLKEIINQSIKNYRRLGKYILADLNNGCIILIHLGMSGTLNLKKVDSDSYLKHDHIILQGEDCQLVYNDPRRFGMFNLYTAEELKDNKFIKNIGYDPISKDFTDLYHPLDDIIMNSSRYIYKIIMDQKVVAGIGNIYACESLNIAGISPYKLGNTFSKKDLYSLRCVLFKILNKAVQMGGTTLKDYKDIEGKKGSYVKLLQAYGCIDKVCKSCNKGNITKEIISGRTVYYCSFCQD